MAGFTLSAGSYPSGATVTARPVSAFEQQSPPTGSPPGSATSTATAASDGSVVFTGLADNTAYFAHSLVGSENRYIRFTPGADSPGASHLTYDAETDTVDVQAANFTVAGQAVGGAFAHLVEDVDLERLVGDWTIVTSTDPTAYQTLGAAPGITLYNTGGIESLSPSTANPFSVVGVVGEAQSRLLVRASGDHEWSNGTDPSDTTLKRAAAGVLALSKLGVGNSAAGSTPGTCVKKVEVFDGSGASLGFIAVYDAIS